MSDKSPKGGGFILTDSKPEEVFSPEDFSEEQQMMRDSVKEFMEKEVLPEKKRFEQHDYKFTEEILKKAGELGFLGIPIPEEYDGLAMGYVSSMLVADYFSGASGSLATAFGAHTGIGTLPIMWYGTEAQKKKYLPKLANGKWLGAYALTEPGAGSDANAGKTKAELTDDGNYYILNGQKIWTSNSGFADVFIVFARIEDDKYISAFIVEYDENNPNGISLGDEEEKMGIHSSSTRQVFFSDTKIAAENMLSKRGKGFKIAMNTLNTGRIKLAAACLDSQRQVITNAVNYANSRQQFDTTIANFEAIKGKLAKMATAAYAGESMTYRTAKLIENKTEELKHGDKTPEAAELEAVEEFAVECSLLKVACSEDIQNCSDEGIQIYGGIGFSKDYPMEAAYRDARITRIYEGTNEINRMHAVGMLIKKALKGDLNLRDAAKNVQDELSSVPSFEKPDFSDLFAEEKDILGQLKKIFLMVAGSAIKKYGEKLENHQLILMAAADLLIQIYRAESTILRTEKLVKRNGEENLEPQIAMSRLCLYKAVEKINKEGKKTIISLASGDEQRMLLLGLKRFTKYQHYPDISELKTIIADKLIKENAYSF